MHGQQVFDLGEVAVELSAEFDQQSIVGKFKQQFGTGGSDGVSAAACGRVVIAKMGSRS
jgi:hypothetical protein